MPTLQQIQDYVNNRRKKICDENNLDDFQEYVKTLKYKENVSKDNELFAFGEKIGNGSDGEHFQIGLTSKTMLSRVELNGMLHLDATYQIVKYKILNPEGGRQLARGALEFEGSRRSQRNRKKK